MRFPAWFAMSKSTWTSRCCFKDISARFFLTPKYVSSLFRERLHTTYSEYLNSLRVAKAMRLLRHTQRSVKEDITRKTAVIPDSRLIFLACFTADGRQSLQYRKGGRQMGHFSDQRHFTPQRR